MFEGNYIFKTFILNIRYLINHIILKSITPAENLFPNTIYKLRLSDESKNKLKLQQIF